LPIGSNAADAAVLLEAARCADLHPVRVTSVEQQALQATSSTSTNNQHASRSGAFHRAPVARWHRGKMQPAFAGAMAAALPRRSSIFGHVLMRHL
jgi:hypothetical protein